MNNYLKQFDFKKYAPAAECTVSCPDQLVVKYKRGSGIQRFDRENVEYMLLSKDVRIKNSFCKRIAVVLKSPHVSEFTKD